MAGPKKKNTQAQQTETLTHLLTDILLNKYTGKRQQVHWSNDRQNTLSKRQTNALANRQTDRQTDKYTDRHTDRQIQYTEQKTKRQTTTQTKRQTDIHTNTLTKRQRVRQIH